MRGDKVVRLEPHEWDQCPNKRDPSELVFLFPPPDILRSWLSATRRGLSPEPDLAGTPISAFQPPEL